MWIGERACGQEKGRYLCDDLQADMVVGVCTAQGWGGVLGTHSWGGSVEGSSICAGHHRPGLATFKAATVVLSHVTVTVAPGGRVTEVVRDMVCRDRATARVPDTAWSRRFVSSTETERWAVVVLPSVDREVATTGYLPEDER